MTEKYLADGREVELIATLPDGRYLVSQVYLYDNEEYYNSDAPFIADRIFDNPPTEKVNAEIKALHDEIERLEGLKKTLAREVDDFKRSNSAKMKEYARFDELTELNDFIAGRITHYLVTEYQPEIITFDDTVCEYGKRDKKLLVLFGDSKGNLRWKINQYSDGSGSYREITPCTSLNDAMEKGQAFINENTKDLQKYPSMGLVRFAQKYGLNISAEYIDRCKERERADFQRHIRESEECILRYKKHLEDLG